MQTNKGTIRIILLSGANINILKTPDNKTGTGSDPSYMRFRGYIRS